MLPIGVPPERTPAPVAASSYDLDMTVRRELGIDSGHGHILAPHPERVPQRVPQTVDTAESNPI